MRASTVGSRFLDRCGDSLGVEISFKDICILAAVLNSRCRSEMLGRGCRRLGGWQQVDLG